MIKLFLKLLGNKNFIIWIILFFTILFFIYNPVLNFKTEYMQLIGISDYIYIFYVFLLPMSFYEMGVSMCFLLELCYLSIVGYIVVEFINFFFNKCVSVTLTRISRKNWIKKVLEINIIFSLAISITYIVFFILLCTTNEINISISLNNIIPMIYKVMLTIIIPNIFLIIYIKTDNVLISLGFFTVSYVILELLIKTTFNDKLLEFNYFIIIMLLLISLYICICKMILKLFEGRDL